MAERDSGNSWDSLWVDLGLEAPRPSAAPAARPAPKTPPAPTPVAIEPPTPVVVEAPAVPVERPRPAYLTSDEVPDVRVVAAAAVPTPIVDSSDDDDDDGDGLETTNPDGTPGKKRRRRRRRGRKGRDETAEGEMATPTESVVAATAVEPTHSAPEAAPLAATADTESSFGSDLDDDEDEGEAGVDIIQSESEEMESFGNAEPVSAMDEELDQVDSTPERKEWSVVSWAELVGGLNR